MSDLIRHSHTARCDWPGCGVLGSDDEWIGWPSYKDAIEVLQDLDNGEEWYHDAENRKDYCGRHWHWEDDEPVPLALVDMVNILPPGVRLGIAKPGGFWLCIGGKGLYCDRHRRMIADADHQESGPREES